MSCFHPLYKFDVGLLPSGKRDLRWIRNPNQSIADLKRIYGKDLVPIPCGKCLGCQLDYARDWATRCMLESSLYDENCFLTLTFDEQNVPQLVSKKDLTNFIRRLKDRYPEKNIRFFGCGEHGSLGRSHYHVIIFGFDFPDKKVYKDNLFNSDILSSLWPYGHAVIGSVTPSSCGYVARYCMKKRSGDSKFKDEFVLMSRMPGIGEYYYYKHPDMFDSDYVYGNFGKRFKAPIPRYYKKLAEKNGECLNDYQTRCVKRANDYELFDVFHNGFYAFEQAHYYFLDRLVVKTERLKRFIA